MPVLVVPFNPSITLAFPTRVYLDTNFVIYVRDAGSSKYHRASACFAQLVNQNVELNLSALMFDELWCAYLKKLYEAANKTKLTAAMYKNTPAIWQAHWPQIDQMTTMIRTAQRVVELASPADLVSRAQALMLINPLAPRDAFHLALTLYHGIPWLITADRDYQKVQLPAGSPNLTVLKI